MWDMLSYILMLKCAHLRLSKCILHDFCGRCVAREEGSDSKCDEGKSQQYCHKQWFAV
jgi:hypothetical protein